MKTPEEQTLLRIFIGETERLHGKPLYEQIVLKANELKIAGATVIRGIMGFGAESHMHSAKLLRLTEDLPLIIEMVDTEEKLDLIRPFLDENIKEGIVTLEKIRVITYSSKT